MATFLGILLLSLMMGVSLGADDIEIAISPADEIKQGDAVTITCTAPELSVLEYIRIARTVDGTRTTIADAGELESQFERTGRYFVDYLPLQHELKLTITEIKGQDGGSIACVRMSSERMAEQVIDVKVPPKEVRLLRIDTTGVRTPVNEGDVIQFYEGDKAGLSCEVVVEGSRRNPDVQITIGDRDVTDQFDLEENLDERDEHGLVMIENRPTYTLLQDTPDIKHNAKDITCQATMPGYEPVKASAKIQVYYGPRFTCSEKQQAKLGALDAQIKCVVKMSPGVNEDSGSVWSWGKKGNRTELATGDSLDEFSAEMVDLGEDAAEFILTIDTVTEDHFRKYRLEVGNSIGTERHTITLDEAPQSTTTTTTTTTTKKPPVDDTSIGDNGGGAACLQASLIFSFVSILLALL